MMQNFYSSLLPPTHVFYFLIFAISGVYCTELRQASNMQLKLVWVMLTFRDSKGSFSQIFNNFINMSTLASVSVRSTGHHWFPSAFAQFTKPSLCWARALCTTAAEIKEGLSLSRYAYKVWKPRLALAYKLPKTFLLTGQHVC